MPMSGPAGAGFLGISKIDTGEVVPPGRRLTCSGHRVGVGLVSGEMARQGGRSGVKRSIMHVLLDS
jgi:hypothetical protein